MALNWRELLDDFDANVFPGDKTSFTHWLSTRFENRREMSVARASNMDVAAFRDWLANKAAAQELTGDADGMVCGFVGFAVGEGG